MEFTSNGNETVDNAAPVEDFLDEDKPISDDIEVPVLGKIAAGTPVEAIQNEVSRIPLPSNLEKNAMEKLTHKNCDWIIANDVSKEKVGFNSEFNEVIIYYKDKKKEKLSFKKKLEI